jgi:hypothetical protein
MHTELVTQQPGTIFNEKDADLLHDDQATYKGAKVIYLAAHRSKQMIREAEELERQNALVGDLPYGRISFQWFSQFINWFTGFFRNRRN